jgi:hemerythrin-like metal-binding protein
MDLMAWDESYSVGNILLDSDHRILFTLINQLHDAMETGQSRAVVGSILSVLAEYAQYHFQREEAMFGVTPYPDADAHKRQHRDLEAEVAAIRGRWTEGEREALSEDILALLKKWLTNHIMTVDKSYGPWLVGADGDCALRRRP